MLDILFQLNLFRQFVQIPVNPGPHISAAASLLQELDMLPFSPPHHRGQQLNPGPLRHGQNLIHHLVHGLPADLPATFRTMRNPDPGIQKAQIVIDLRHGPYRGTGIAVRGLLINGYGRRKSFDALHLRLLHLSQKLPRIGGQRLHVASLSFRINRIKRQRRLPGAAQPGQHYQLIPRNIQGNILQIMFIRTTYLNILLRHVLSLSCNLFLRMALHPLRFGRHTLRKGIRTLIHGGYHETRHLLSFFIRKQLYSITPPMILQTFVLSFPDNLTPPHPAAPCPRSFQTGIAV